MGGVVRHVGCDWPGGTAGAGDPVGPAKRGETLMAVDPGHAQLDPAHPPAMDPRQTGVFGPRTPVSRRERAMAECVTCGGETVQDVFDVIVGAWAGASLRFHARLNTVGKVGQRARFSVCATCGCVYPVDDAARQFVRAKGGEFFNPAKLSPERRARAAQGLRPRQASQTSVVAILLGLVAFFAAPLVWGILGILLGLFAFSTRSRPKIAMAAIVIAVLGTAVGTVLHHAHPFGYG
jgi:hypothetical protein